MCRGRCRQRLAKQQRQPDQEAERQAEDSAMSHLRMLDQVFPNSNGYKRLARDGYRDLFGLRCRGRTHGAVKSTIASLSAWALTPFTMSQRASPTSAMKLMTSPG